jgi:hypothetical protein
MAEFLAARKQERGIEQNLKLVFLSPPLFSCAAPSVDRRSKTSVICTEAYGGVGCRGGMEGFRPRVHPHTLSLALAAPSLIPLTPMLQDHHPPPPHLNTYVSKASTFTHTYMRVLLEQVFEEGD